MDEETGFVLSRESHNESLGLMLSDMFTNHTFTDVTLVCDDEIMIPAHRNILAACSSLFKKILHSISAHNNPVIYLKGTSSLQIKQLLQYIYQGTISIDRSLVEDFIRVAKEFGVLVLPPQKEESPTNQVEVEQDEPSSDVLESLQEPSNNMSTTFSEVKQELEEGEGKETSDQLFVASGDDTQSNEPMFNSSVECTTDLIDKLFRELEPTKKVKGTKNMKQKYKYKFSCEKCDYTAKNEITLKNHIKTVHDLVEYPCSICDYLGSLSAIRAHINTEHKEYFQCKYCTFIAQEKTAVTLHSKNEHSVNIKCSFCEKVFTKSYHLKNHVKVHHEGIKFPCNQCDYQANEPSNLRTHKITYHDSILYPCPECTFSGNHLNLKRHIKMKHKQIKI